MRAGACVAGLFHINKEKNVSSIRRILVAVFVVQLGILGGCGGGSDDAAGIYGSIALNLTTKAGGITARYGTQAEANNAAINQCGVGCATVLEFWGSGQCGAVARGTNFALGWASDGSQSRAESSAIAKCTSAGGTFCTIQLSMCN